VAKLTRDEIESIIANLLCDKPGRLTAEVANHISMSSGGVRHYLDQMEENGLIKAKDGGWGHWSQYQWYLVSDYEARRREPFKAITDYLNKETREVIHKRYGQDSDKENSQYWEGQWQALIAVEKEVRRLIKFVEEKQP
jgi:predicted transcriptional regulator